jgi:hypothetical protein
MLEQPLSERLRAIRDAQAAPDAEETAPPLPPPAPRLPLGQLLVEKGALSDAELMLALAQQRQDGRPLGQILLEMGVISPGDLARTLTEQHGFDFGASLRRRLSAVDSPVDDAAPEEEPVAATPEQQYLVREPGAAEPLHVADSFLDAADAAFELIEEHDPEQLEVVRSGNGELEQLWAYRRDEAGAEPPAA